MKIYVRVILLSLVVLLHTLPVRGESNLAALVKLSQPAIATVITYNSEKSVQAIGSGFFIDRHGHFITNYHVIQNAFNAEIKIYNGKKYPIRAVVSQNTRIDLVKVLVDIPPEDVRWLEIDTHIPTIAERIFVVGSPLGLEQTVSEGIVSAVREMPVVGRFFQMSAPISVGSSGSPVINMHGKVVGIVTFMMIMGQNLNFAIPSKGVLSLEKLPAQLSISEWTIAGSKESPQLAEKLCRQGFTFSIDGKYKEALHYYREAAETNPANMDAWYGLTQCYVGLDQPQEVIETFNQAIRFNPNDAQLHYNLGNFYNAIGKPESAVASYKEAIRVDPDSALAHDKLGVTQGDLGNHKAALEAHHHVVRLLPKYAPGYFNVGVASGLLGNHIDAISAYKEVISIDPAFESAYTNLGLAYDQIGDFKLAGDTFKEAIRVDPNDATAHYQLGLFYLREKNRLAALDEYRILRSLDVKRAAALFDKIYPK